MKEEENKARYIARSDNVRQFRHITGQSIKRMLHEVYNNIIINFTVTWKYIKMAEDIYIPSVPNMQVNTMSKKVKHTETAVVSKFPQAIINKYKRFIFCCNLMHINVLAFLNMVSWGVILGTGILIKNLYIDTIEAVINQVHTLYIQQGLKIIRLCADCAFEPFCTKVLMLVIDLNTASKKERVSEIERFNCVVK